MRQSLIFSRNLNNGELSLDRIQALAPAAFSTTKAERLTDRYQSLDTSALMPVLSDYGYVPVQAAQKRKRGSGIKGEHSQHMLAFAHRDTLAVEDGERPEIIVYNSHDGTGAVRIFAGIYRFICSNGIISGAGSSLRVYHSSNALAGFEQHLQSIVASLPELMNRVQRMRSISLTADRAYEMARLAVAARWDVLSDTQDNMQKLGLPLSNLRGTFATESTLRDVLKVSRPEDDLSDAYTVFNRIQESVVRGQAFVKSFTDKAPDGAMRKARPISSISEHVRINQKLWDVAEDIAEVSVA